MNKEVIIDIENPKDNDLISRQAVLEIIDKWYENNSQLLLNDCIEDLIVYVTYMPSVRPQEQTYTEDELKEFADGISLRLCSLKSAEYWGGKYTEQIAWLEQLYAKVKADMSGAKMVEPQESEDKE